MKIHYPERKSHWAHRFTRLLFKSCAAQDIGHQAVCLVIHIAHTEDAARYQGPVRFWNSQLMEVLGFKSPKQLNNARDKAVHAGWLIYHRTNDRSVGHYWTETPPSVSKFSDDPIEEMRSEYGKDSENGKGMRSESGTHSGTRSGTHCGTRSGKPSNPTPKPTPNPKKAATVSPDYAAGFEEFWKAYPANAKGRKRGKAEAFALWRSIPSSDRAALLAAAKNYAVEETEFVRDPERFLKKDWWREWVGPPESKPSIDDAPSSSSSSAPAASIAERRAQIATERNGAANHA